MTINSITDLKGDAGEAEENHNKNNISFKFFLSPGTVI
jgi:hypothetical protein